MRRAFLNRVAEIIRSENDTTFFTVDIGMWAIKDILDDFPERCMNVGIYEDGMFSIAAGMSKIGLIPIIFGIQPYLVERALEQIKLDFAYQKLGANIIGTGAAVDYSKYGYSHYCPEDAMIIKAIPGVEFVVPGTAKQFIQLFNQSYRNGHPTFFRISDYPNTGYDPDVEFGKAVLMQRGSQATVIAISVMLDEVMQACKGKDVTVLYYTTLEPFDKTILAPNCPSGNILICEPEFVGTLANDIIESLPDQKLCIKQIGFPREIFRNYGTYAEKMKYYKLTAEDIEKTLINLIGD